MILWQNLAVKPCSRCLRILFISFVSFVLMLVSFTGIILSKHYEGQFTEEYQTTDCGNIEVTQTEAFEDY